MADKLPARRRFRAIPAIGLALTLPACGGRVADPVSTISAFDLRLTCDHVAAEKAANVRRIADLRDERNTNRLRNLTRIPGALIGNPLSAFALADTSRAIYLEIDALEARNKHLDQLHGEKRCDEKPAPKPPVEQAAATPENATPENAAPENAAPGDAPQTPAAPAGAADAGAPAPVEPAPEAAAPAQNAGQ